MNISDFFCIRSAHSAVIEKKIRFELWNFLCAHVNVTFVGNTPAWFSFSSFNVLGNGIKIAGKWFTVNFPLGCCPEIENKILCVKGSRHKVRNQLWLKINRFWPQSAVEWSCDSILWQLNQLNLNQFVLIYIYMIRISINNFHCSCIWNTNTHTNTNRKWNSSKRDERVHLSPRLSSVKLKSTTCCWQRAGVVANVYLPFLAKQNTYFHFRYLNMISLESIQFFRYISLLSFFCFHNRNEIA